MTIKDWKIGTKRISAFLLITAILVVVGGLAYRNMQQMGLMTDDILSASPLVDATAMAAQETQAVAMVQSVAGMGAGFVLSLLLGVLITRAIARRLRRTGLPVDGMEVTNVRGFVGAPEQPAADQRAPLSGAVTLPDSIDFERF